MLPSSEPWGNPVVESLENFYGIPVEQVAEKLAVELSAARERGLGLMATAAAVRCSEFSQLYLEQRTEIAGRIAGAGLPDGHLRAAFIGRELVAVPKGGRPTVYLDGKHLGHDRLPSTLSVSRGEIKASLCYAHDLVVEDPFDEEQDLVALVRELRELDPASDAIVLPDPDLFVANVAAIAQLAPLARAGVLKFVPRTLAMNPRLSGVNASNAWDVGPSADNAEREIADRMMRVWLHSGGTVVPVFEGDAQETRFADLLGVLAGAVNKAEAARLRKLGTLALPSAEELDLRHMVEIREESVFQTFRARQRAVLSAIGEMGANDHAAAALFREEMRAAADEVQVKTRRQVLSRSLSPKLLGWGVGSVVGVAFDWRAAAAVIAAAATSKLADFLTGSTAQALADATPKATHALKHHYATLGRRTQLPG